MVMVAEAAAAQRDPLLRTTRVVLVISAVVAIVATAAAILAIPATWVFRSAIVVEGAAPTTGFLIAANVLMAGFVAITACAFLFLRKLIALIDTVAQGVPFSRENAARLRAMAWLALALQGIALLAAPLSAWIESLYPQAQFDVRVDFTGILTSLLLFILARVFDTGAALAEDAEGTV